MQKSLRVLSNICFEKSRLHHTGCSYLWYFKERELAGSEPYGELGAMANPGAAYPRTVR